jgi:hypothetical protein
MPKSKPSVDGIDELDSAADDRWAAFVERERQRLRQRVKRKVKHGVKSPNLRKFRALTPGELVE